MVFTMTTALVISKCFWWHYVFITVAVIYDCPHLVWLISPELRLSFDITQIYIKKTSHLSLLCRAYCFDNNICEFVLATKRNSKVLHNMFKDVHSYLTTRRLLIWRVINSSKWHIQPWWRNSIKFISGNINLILLSGLYDSNTKPDLIHKTFKSSIHKRLIFTNDSYYVELRSSI